MVRQFFFPFCFILKQKVCNKCLVVKKQQFCLIITLFRWFLITENKHLSRDPQLSSVTRNCQIYSMQLNTLKTVLCFKFKEFLNFIIRRGTYLLINLCSFVSPNFLSKRHASLILGMQKVTVFIYRLTDPIYR